MQHAYIYRRGAHSPFARHIYCMIYCAYFSHCVPFIRHALRCSQIAHTVYAMLYYVHSLISFFAAHAVQMSCHLQVRFCIALHHCSPQSPIIPHHPPAPCTQIPRARSPRSRHDFRPKNIDGSMGIKPTLPPPNRGAVPGTHPWDSSKRCNTPDASRSSRYRCIQRAHSYILRAWNLHYSSSSSRLSLAFSMIFLASAAGTSS